MKTSRVETTLEAITRLGGRVTKSRVRIVEYLGGLSQPKGIKEIVKAVKGDTVSVYRTIRFLSEHHLVEEFHSPDGTSRYSLCGAHHDHLMCTGCGYVAHVPCREDQVTLPKHKDFKKLTEHQVTYFGTCIKCTA